MRSFPGSELRWSPPPAGVFVLAFLLYCNPYHNSIPHPFLTDDVPSIVQHPDVLEADGIWRLWTHDFHAGRMLDNDLYRPVTMLTLHLNARVTSGRPNAIWYRYVNILLLGVTAWLLGCWLSQHLPLTWAWWSAYAFVAHPIHGHLIHQIVGRADLMTVSGILAFLMFQARARRSGSWTTVSAVGALFAAFVALGAKETGVLLVPMALVHSYTLDGDYQHGDSSDAVLRKVMNTLRCNWVPLVLMTIATALYFAARFWAVGASVNYDPGWDDLTGNPLRGLPFWERLPAALSIACFYAKQVIWPLLTYNHFPVELPAWRNVGPYLGILLLGVTIMIWVFLVRRRHWLSVPWTLALGQYLLLSNLLFPVGVYAANRLMMPTIVAAAALLGFLLHHAELRWPKWRWAVVTAAALVMTTLSSWLVLESPNWQSIQHRASADVERQPGHPVTVFHMGQVFSSAKDYEAAVPWFQAAVGLRPNSIQARYYLANALIASQRYLEAREHNDELLRLRPGFLEARIQRTSVLIMIDDLSRAAEELAALEELAPTHRILMRNLAVLAVKQGNRELAITRYEALLRRYPEDELAVQELRRVMSGDG